LIYPKVIDEEFIKSIRLWKGADPGLPEVADAREKLKASQ
jgi:nitrogen-specific signal transduction histidine kinase